MIPARRKGNIDLSIACAIDHDIAWQVKSGKATSSRARSDLSVIKSLQGIYKNVAVVSIREGCTKSLDELLGIKPDVVFNLAFSAHPYEAGFAGCLDLLELPYTGSGPTGICLANDKIRSRLLLQAAGIRVPQFVEILPGKLPDIGFPPPFIVKPRSRASSDGIYTDSVVTERKGIRMCGERIWHQFGESAICEEFVIGREFRVGMVEMPGKFRIAGISEWHFGSAEPGWGFKFGALKTNRRVRKARAVTKMPAEISRSLSRKLAGIARAAVSMLSVNGYATLDVRVDDCDRVTVLELNANPGLSSQSTTWGHPSFESNIKHIVNSAIRRT